MSAAEFELLPEVPGKQELLQGELITLPLARLSHNKIVQALFEVLRLGLDPSRVHMEAGYQMSRDTWLQPDVSVTWPGQPVENDYLQGSPMIAVEVVSPGNAAEEIDAKIAAYLTGGAAEVWVVYPRTRCMMVHRSTAVERITERYSSDSVPASVALNDILPRE
jgi:Uma2 family endonuclease